MVSSVPITSPGSVAWSPIVSVASPYPDPDKQEELAAASVNRPSSDGISEVPEKNSA